jgi:eukaryotic-like serine/threonine-protein kinase
LGNGLIDRIRRRDIPPLLYYALVIAGAFVVGVVIFNFIIMPILVGRSDTIIVPSLQGMSIKQAGEVCGKEHLKLTVSGSRNSEEVPEGYVLEQTPRQGEALKEGRTIKVMVSAGPKTEAVPDLSGKTVREAELQLEAIGLARGRIVRVFSDVPGPDNSVLTESPSAGARLPRGASVDLLIGMRGEPQTYVMPNLVGRDLPFVRDKLEKMGFNVVRVVAKRGGSRFPNAIISQNPKAGSPIKEGDTIELVVSTVE